MDRFDLLINEATGVIQAINDLILTLYFKGLYMTSWYGTLPGRKRIEFSKYRIRDLIKGISGRIEREKRIGQDNRSPSYEPLPSSADDDRIPWYLYWEIFWVIRNGPRIRSDMRVLDAGGASSLFSCYLASLGCEVHSIDINKQLVSNSNRIAKAMGWNMFSYVMNIKRLKFQDEYFDRAYSICVFEHLDYEIKQLALCEIARCLKPNGILSITFDYRNPAPTITGYGQDRRQRNQINTKEDIKRSFLSSDNFELFGNKEFFDNMESYLVHPRFNNAPYTFGAIFLKKKS